MASPLHIKGIRKAFGKGDKAVEVLKRIDIDVEPGEFLILVGPSGCGKSTLLNIIAGLEEPTEGELHIAGKNVIGMAPAQRDIAMVFQSYALYPTMTVADNIGFALEMRKVPADVRKKRIDEVLELLEIAHLKDRVSGNLSAGESTRLNLCKALLNKPELLLLDEPTASLDRSEVEKLFGIVRQLRDRGLAIVFITHFLDQVFELSDRVTVLRNGRLVGTQAIASLDRTSLVRMMLGKDLAFHHPDVLGEEGEVGETLMEFEGFGLSNSVQPFDLKIHRGEVVGVAGLLGSGRTEMARLMFGIDQADSGSIKIDGSSRQVRNPREAVELGFGFCPEDRKIDGIFGDLSVRENIVIAMQARLGWFRALNRDEQLEIAGNFIEATAETPFFQIGESKYGKPVLDRVITPNTPLDEAAKCVLVSMDSTLKSNLSVGLPLDLVVYEANQLQSDKITCIDNDNPYFRMLHDTWGQKLREVFDSIEDPTWDGAHTEVPLLSHHPHSQPLKKITNAREKLI